MCVGVFPIANLKVDITAEAQAERARRIQDAGNSPEALAFKIIIEIVVSSIKGVLEASAKIGNRRVGRTTVEYVSDPTWRRNIVKDDEDAQIDECTPSDEDQDEVTDTADADADEDEEKEETEEDE
ncbi:hypothetical protein PV04_07448 [Phialophora macrospora]|uniref:Uncharacterized protein n=1 Tax=Phialophora macrospora TaxID=1851006 RepID=A0A0D2DSL5_9EURO|nr:hypothetical protein PV04_07448 [Phialophora macrospora]